MCIVAFYQDAGYSGTKACYVPTSLPFPGYYVLEQSSIGQFNDVWSSFKNAEQICIDRNGVSCQIFGYNIDSGPLDVYRHINFDTLHTYSGTYDDNFTDESWCWICDSVNDRISSFRSYFRAW